MSDFMFRFKSLFMSRSQEFIYSRFSWNVRFSGLSLVLLHFMISDLERDTIRFHCLLTVLFLVCIVGFQPT